MIISAGLLPVPHSVSARAGVLQVSTGLPAQPAAPPGHLLYSGRPQTPHQTHLHTGHLQEAHTGGDITCVLMYCKKVNCLI